VKKVCDINLTYAGYNTLSMDDLNLYGPMGVFIPVDDLIDQYCPNYKDVLSRFPNLDGMSTSLADGKKYSWGTVNESPARDYPDNLYINKTWLDNLGLEVPTTMEEYSGDQSDQRLWQLLWSVWSCGGI